MYAVIATGGKQYRVSVGDEEFLLKNLLAKPENLCNSTKYWPYRTTRGFRVGNPELEGAVVEGEIVKQGKQKKIIVFKYKAKKGYRRKMGHRQPYTRVRITKITA